MHRVTRQFVRTPRQGTLLPAIAIAILTVGCCLALVLDRLWLDAARGELQTAVEAAALAAAGRLADDERINLNVEPHYLTAAAELAAEQAAGMNRVAGRPIALSSGGANGITFGRYQVNLENGAYEFIETNELPTTVRVRLEHSRSLGNPVARLFSGLTGEVGGDAFAKAEASLSNLIAGVRPFEGGPVPAFPLAIYEQDPTGERTDTWIAQIESGGGGDNWTFNHDSRQVEQGPDGLPEMVLHPMPPRGEPHEANFQLLNIGNGLIEDELVRQFEGGWRVGDLADYGGELRVDDLTPPIECSAEVFEPTVEACLRMIGQKRLVLLYVNHQASSGDLGEITPTRLAAIRIMAVEADTDGQPQITVQPSVVATRTALALDEVLPPDEAADLGNPYVYKISLTN